MKRVNLRGQAAHLCYVESDQLRDTEYQIGRRPNGTLACACMAFVFNREKPKTCKHIDAYAPAYLLGGMKETTSVTWNPLPASKGPKETFTFRRAITFGAVPTGGQT